MKEMDQMPDRRRWITAAVLLLAAILSFAVIAPYASSKDTYQKYTDSLDEKKEIVLKMTGAATATSLAITLLPGDAATPVAEKLMDLSGYFLLVLCALFLEEYLLTITGYAAFKILIPLAMLLFLAGLFVTKNSATKNVLTKLATKLVVFSFAIVLVIPVSVNASLMIERTYEQSLADRIAAAEENLNAIEAVTNPAKTEEKEEVQQEQEKPKEETPKADAQTNAWDAFKNAFSNATEKAGTVADQAASAVSEAVAGVSDTISAAMSGELLKRAEDTLNQFIEAIAVMIITSCVIPILIILCFVLLVKMILGIDFRQISLDMSGQIK